MSRTTSQTPQNPPLEPCIRTWNICHAYGHLSKSRIKKKTTDVHCCPDTVLISPTRKGVLCQLQKGKADIIEKHIFSGAIIPLEDTVQSFSRIGRKALHLQSPLEHFN